MPIFDHRPRAANRFVESSDPPQDWRDAVADGPEAEDTPSDEQRRRGVLLPKE